MNRSSIEWTEVTWNPVTGCSKTSPGCLNCYAERMARRLQCMGQPNYRNGFKLTIHEHMLELPLTWRTPRMIFVNSMSDLLHRDVPLDFILRAFDIMRRASWHTFQVLTKRSQRLMELEGVVEWPSNVWVGVSVENADYRYRMDHLRHTSAAIKFVSFEPLLGSVGRLVLDGIDWAIVGGESGPGARQMKAEWVTGIRDQCLQAGTAFFFKQWGGFHKKKNGRLLDGRVWNELPGVAVAATAR